MARKALTPVLGRAPTTFALFRETKVGGANVDLAAADDLAHWVRLSSGRLPRTCTAARCEVVQLAGNGPIPRRFVRVGRGTLVSQQPVRLSARRADRRLDHRAGDSLAPAGGAPVPAGARRRERGQAAPTLLRLPQLPVGRAARAGRRPSVEPRPRRSDAGRGGIGRRHRLLRLHGRSAPAGAPGIPRNRPGGAAPASAARRRGGRAAARVRHPGRLRPAPRRGGEPAPPDLARRDPFPDRAPVGRGGRGGRGSRDGGRMVRRDRPRARRRGSLRVAGRGDRHPFGSFRRRPGGRGRARHRHRRDPLCLGVVAACPAGRAPLHRARLRRGGCGRRGRRRVRARSDRHRQPGRRTRNGSRPAPPPRARRLHRRRPGGARRRLRLEALRARRPQRCASPPAGRALARTQPRASRDCRVVPRRQPRARALRRRLPLHADPGTARPGRLRRPRRRDRERGQHEAGARPPGRSVRRVPEDREGGAGHPPERGRAGRSELHAGRVAEHVTRGRRRLAVELLVAVALAARRTPRPGGGRCGCVPCRCRRAG